MDFILFEVHRSMNTTPGFLAKLTGITYFARDPLRSYFDEPQKNAICFLNNKMYKDIMILVTL